jgi:hypothetical protein
MTGREMTGRRKGKKVTGRKRTGNDLLMQMTLYRLLNFPYNFYLLAFSTPFL